MPVSNPLQQSPCFAARGNTGPALPGERYYEWREITVPDQNKPTKMPFYVSRRTACL
jgi:hypothetical protein